MLAVSPCVLWSQIYTPSNWGGSLSYGYRYLSHGKSDNSQGQLATLSLSGGSYLSQPWLANYNAGINFSFDNSQYGEVDRNSGLVTGRLMMNVLPESQFPLELQYLATDSRVETEILDPVGGIFTDKLDYRLQRFFARQSYIASQALRLNLTYDNTSADSDTSGQFERNIAGFHMGLRSGYHNFRTNFSIQDTTRSGSGIAEDNQVLTVDHQYYPHSSFVVTTLASDVEVDRTFAVTGEDLSQNVNHQSQLFSNFYWRPESKPFILNGGLRIAQIQDEVDGERRNDNGSATFNVNGIYQYSLRTTYSMAFTFFGNKTGGDRDGTGSDQRMGVTYRSDTYGIGSFIYNYFADTSATNSLVENKQTNVTDESQFANLTLGHGVSRHWPFIEGRGRVTFSLNQRISERAQFRDDIHNTGDNGDNFDDLQGLNHSASLAWSLFEAGATSLLQLTASDVRDLDQNNTQSSLYNLQISRVQSISRNSSFNGNISAQSHHQVVLGQGQGSVTTISGVATYTHNRLFRVPHMNYLSRLSLVRPDDNFANRGTSLLG